jgi:hypothetical protein
MVAPCHCAEERRKQQKIRAQAPDSSNISKSLKDNTRQMPEEGQKEETRTGGPCRIRGFPGNFVPDLFGPLCCQVTRDCLRLKYMFRRLASAESTVQDSAAKNQ